MFNSWATCLSIRIVLIEVSFLFPLPAFQWQFQQAPSLTACWWQDCTRPQVCRLHRALEVLMLLDLVSYPHIYHQELSMVKQQQILFFETSVLKGSDIDDFRVTNLKRFLCCLLDVRWLEISHVTVQPTISEVWQSFYPSLSVDAVMLGLGESGGFLCSVI